MEIQRRDEGADAHRARYNSSLLDANLTSPGNRYDALGKTYVIFITERDVLKEGQPIYHIDRYVRETGKPFEDGSHILYVNAQCRSDTPLGKLMHDFRCTDARDMNYPVLAERVHYFKDNVKGAMNMCRAVETLVDGGTKIWPVENNPYANEKSRSYLRTGDKIRRNSRKQLAGV